MIFQTCMGIYSGFFGAGMGILTLAALSTIKGIEDPQELNALKCFTSAINYSIAAVTFIIAGAIDWPFTLIAMVTAGIGGYIGAHVAKRLPGHWLKRIVIAVGATLTVVYFVKSA